jgi:NADPH2:quinone reductase
VDYTHDGWAEEVRGSTEGRGVDVVLEMVGGGVAAESLSALAPFGRLVTYGQGP